MKAQYDEVDEEHQRLASSMLEVELAKAADATGHRTIHQTIPVRPWEAPIAEDAAPAAAAPLADAPIAEAPVTEAPVPAAPAPPPETAEELNESIAGAHGEVLLNEGRTEKSSMTDTKLGGGRGADTKPEDDGEEEEEVEDVEEEDVAASPEGGAVAAKKKKKKKIPSKEEAPITSGTANVLHIP